ncbi:MAG: hypothetical protein JSW51_01115 [Gemmatimonadota bacterium]|nr:MAG: hypothetical protein JSW51_01115 [Gemmatimonadota bacterium]
MLAITWQMRLRPDRHSLMLWDSKQETVVRLHVEDSAATWESWRGVDRSHMLTDDPAKEFDYASHDTGENKAPLSGTAGQFVIENAGDVYSLAITPHDTRDPPELSSGF